MNFDFFLMCLDLGATQYTILLSDKTTYTHPGGDVSRCPHFAAQQA